MVSRKELTVIIITAVMAKIVLVFPKLLISNSGSAAWLQIMYNIITAAIIFFIISKVYKSNKNVIELAGEMGGKLLKIPTGIIVFTIFMINYSLIIRIFPETIKTVLLQNFDTNLITVLFMATIGIGAMLGIEAIARVNYLFMPIIGGILVLFLIMLIPQYDIYNIFPILGNGADKLFLNGFHTVSVYSDLLLVNILLPYYENNAESKKSLKRAFLITAPLIIVIILAYCLVYPYPVSGEFTIPFYQLARIMHMGDFLGRFEPVFQFAWSIMLFLYASIYVFVLCKVWQTTFGLEFYRPLVFPVVIISGVIALLPATLSDIINNAALENKIVYPAAFLLPIIFGIAALIKNRRGKEK